MKKIKFVAVALMAMFIVSCSESKEDKFLNELEDFVESIESSDYDDFNSDEDKELFLMRVKQLNSKVKNLYGVDLTKGLHFVECAEAAGMDLNEKQKEKAYELENRLINKVKEVMKERREREGENGPDEISGDFFDGFGLGEDADEANSLSDSEDGDALLESYEEYVDKSIELAEDMTNGENISADDYKDLMEQGMELSKKIANAQMEGTLSASQLNRFNELTAKMAKASLELQKKFQ